MTIHDLFNILALTLGVLNLLLGFIILIKSRLQKQIVYFLLFILFFSCWILTGVLSVYQFNEQSQTVLFDLYFFSAPLAVCAYLLFTLEFPNNLIKPSNKTIIFATIGLGIFFAIVSVTTDLVVQSTNPTPLGFAYKQGPLDIPYAIFHIFGIAAGLIIFRKQYSLSHGLAKLQTYYFLLGFLITGSSLIIFNLVLWRVANIHYSEDPLVVSILPNIGRASVTILTIVATYTTLRHRLFGIRVILGEILFWLAGSALVFLFFYGTIVVELRFFDSLTDPLVIFLNVFIALLVFPTLRATNNWLRRAIRKITINVSFDRDHILSEYNKEITQSQATTEIVNSLFRLIDEAYTPKFAGLILIEQRSSNITAEWRGLNPEELMIAQSEEAITQFFNETSVQKRGPLPGVDLQLLFEFPEYQGVLVLGDRKDTAAYANEDVQFLEQVLTYTALNLARTTR